MPANDDLDAWYAAAVGDSVGDFLFSVMPAQPYEVELIAAPVADAPTEKTLSIRRDGVRWGGALGWALTVSEPGNEFRASGARLQSAANGVQLLSVSWYGNAANVNVLVFFGAGSVVVFAEQTSYGGQINVSLTGPGGQGAQAFVMLSKQITGYQIGAIDVVDGAGTGR